MKRRLLSLLAPCSRSIEWHLHCHNEGELARGGILTVVDPGVVDLLLKTLSRIQHEVGIPHTSIQTHVGGDGLKK